MIAIPALLIASALAATAAAPPEQAYMEANAQAMERMMTAMSVKPSGSVDADFVDMMEPHHQGAIEMAELELRFGRDPSLKRIAQEIIVEQQQEIAAMRLALGRPLPASAPAPDQPVPDARTPPPPRPRKPLT